MRVGASIHGETEGSRMNRFESEPLHPARPFGRTQGMIKDIWNGLKTGSLQSLECWQLAILWGAISPPILHRKCFHGDLFVVVEAG